jgi:hypothetical protein
MLRGSAPARIDDGLYGVLRPMLAVSQGRLVALSTPFGRRGRWFEVWTSRGEWQRVEVPATMCPRIGPQFLAEEQAALGPWAYRQEYCCQFSETLDQHFSHREALTRLLRHDPDQRQLIRPVGAGGPGREHRRR